MIICKYTTLDQVHIIPQIHIIFIYLWLILSLFVKKKRLEWALMRIASTLFTVVHVFPSHPFHAFSQIPYILHNKLWWLCVYQFLWITKHKLYHKNCTSINFPMVYCMHGLAKKQEKGLLTRINLSLSKLLWLLELWLCGSFQFAYH